MTNPTSNTFRRQFRRDICSGRFVVEFAASAPEALARAKTIADPMLILILSDINMPGMSELEMLPKVEGRAAEREPVIMTTAYGDEATKKKAAKLGVAGLLTKPIGFALLREEIDERLQRAVVWFWPQGTVGASTPRPHRPSRNEKPRSPERGLQDG